MDELPRHLAGGKNAARVCEFGIFGDVQLLGDTLPETNIFAPENRPGPNRKQSYSNHPFSRAMLVSGRVLLMVQKSGDHQLRLVVYPIIYDGFYTFQVVQDFFHQHYLSDHSIFSAQKTSYNWGEITPITRVLTPVTYL